MHLNTFSSSFSLLFFFFSDHEDSVIKLFFRLFNRRRREDLGEGGGEGGFVPLRSFCWKPSTRLYTNTKHSPPKPHVK